MPLTIVAGPGCDSVGKDSYVESVRESGDVVISAGRLFKSLTGDASVPSSNPAALRAALALRVTAIRLAREKRINAYVLTSNGNRADLDKLRELAGADEIRVLQYTEAQACARIRALVPAGERRAACEQGIKSRWFGRYVAAPTDRLIRPGAPEQREVEMREVETVGGVEIEIREADGGRAPGRRRAPRGAGRIRAAGSVRTWRAGLGRRWDRDPHRASRRRSGARDSDTRAGWLDHHLRDRHA